jgi:uncharacterized protein YndB with AHSA1/START domain
MMIRHFSTICTLFALAVPTAAFADRTLEHEATVDAPVADVWDAFTTNEGFESWAVAHAEIDLRVGGDMRTSYNPQSTLHDEHTIVNRILSLEPQRMLSIRNVQAPAGFKNAELFQGCWTVIYFEPIAPDRTHVRIAGMGYGEGPGWDDIYNKFKWGNGYTLQKLQERFAPLDQPAVANDPQRVMELLGKLVGGEWIHDGQAPDGSMFLVRHISQRGPDGVSIISNGMLGDAEGMTPHQSTQIYRVGGSSADAPQRVVFHAIDEHSAVSAGDIVLINDQTVQWNWNLHALEGKQAAFRVRMKFADDDHYQFSLFMKNDEGEWNEMVDANFERVSEAPEKFRKLKVATAD